MAVAPIAFLMVIGSKGTFNQPKWLAAKEKINWPHKPKDIILAIPNLGIVK